MNVDKTYEKLGLLQQKRFLPFFITQFFGAFNDNVFKNALIILIAFQGAQFTQVNTNLLINIAAALFILPFFLFSATAGQWIDKCEKSKAIRLIKMIEVAIMLLAAFSFIQGDIIVLVALLFLMGSQSAFFGPAKYSYIPQHLTSKELTKGNALVQLGTFVAILTGTIVGGLLIAEEQQGRQLVAYVIVVVSVLGCISSFFIPVTPSLDRDLRINKNIFSEAFRNVRFLKKDRTIFPSVLGISWFWFFGATYLVQLPNYTKTVLNGNEQVVTLLLILFTLGIGGGALICSRLSGKKVEIGLVPLGSIGLTIFSIDLFFARPEVIPIVAVGLVEFLTIDNIRLIIDVTVIGFFGGLYIVPLMSLVQQRSKPEYLSRVIAGNNIFNALLMVLSAVVAIIVLSFGYSIAQLFLVVAIMNIFVAIYVYSVVPEFLMRLLVWLLIHSIYRVKTKGLDKVPENGPAVLVCNHVSFVDALIIAGCVRRPVRFVMYYKIYNLPVLKFIFKTAKAISIAGKYEDENLLNKAFDEIDVALCNGEIVCLFPEGKLTSDGKMGVFKNGVEKIVARRGAPVIPMALTGLWGSVFSRQQSTVFERLLNGFKSKVELIVGDVAGVSEVTAESLQKKVNGLHGGVLGNKKATR